MSLPAVSDVMASLSRSVSVSSSNRSALDDRLLLVELVNAPVPVPVPVRSASMNQVTNVLHETFVSGVVSEPICRAHSVL